MAWMAGVLCFCALYGVFVLTVSVGVRRHYPRAQSFEPFVSVLVPARNEESRIGQCLESLVNQKYPKDRMEVMVIDDASTDATVHVVEEAKMAHAFIRLVRQSQQERGDAPKKSAVQKGVALAKGEIVFTIDADCVAPSTWIRTMVAHFDGHTGLVFGWVGLEQGKGFFHHIQHLEYLSLVGLAAGFVGIGHPTMCNANNLAYRKQVFEQVHGFKGIDHVASGDDELLLQKISDQTNWKIAFCRDRAALTHTSACSHVVAFVSQRIRWASKGMVYRRVWLRFLLIGLWLFYASFPVMLAATVIQPGLWMYPVLIFSTKMLFDLPLVTWSTRRTGHSALLAFLPFAELFQLLYVPLVSLVGTFGLYQWKTT